MIIFDYLKTSRLITDGAMGTYYATRELSEPAIAEYANITSREKIKTIHKEYLNAGAKLLRTNTFAANRTLLSISKEEQADMITAACNIAKEAIEECNQSAFIAGDIGPIPEFATTEEEDILIEYKEMIDVFIKENVDAILFETFPDLRYIKQLARYIKEKNKDTFLMVEFCLNKNGYTRTGASAAKLLEGAADITEIDAVGFNCGIGSGHMVQILNNLNLPKNKYIMISPNAGYPEQYQNRMVFMDNANYFADNCKKIAEFGTAILGACCGSTPSYIEETKKRIMDMEPVRIEALNQEEFISCDKEKNETQASFIINQSKNKFLELLHSGKKVVAVELDPPFNADDKKVIASAEYLKKHNVDIITMADSPMGRSRIDSILMSVKIMNVTGMPVMPHVCCRDKNMISMRSSLLGAYANDIRNLLIVTGDPVPDGSRLKTTGVFDYNSIRLMEYVKEMNEEHFFDEPFVFGGAFDPGVRNIDKAIERMQKKIDAGASYFLTQPIYSDETIDKIRYIKTKVNTKILCGIMPFVSYTNANFIKNEFAGIQVPDEIVARYHENMSKEEAERVGAEIANEIIKKLEPFADGYYFMLPFNRVSLMDKIIIP